MIDHLPLDHSDWKKCRDRITPSQRETDRVFIADSDAMHAAELQQVLESFGIRVAVFPDEKSIIEMIEKDCPDLMVLVPRSPAALRDALASVGSMVKHMERQPELLFLLRWMPQGPADRLLGDRWNVQVLHER